jgi:hypothetical protein
MAFTTSDADVQKQFDPARQRAQQAVNAQTQQRRDAITRKMAQLGGGPSGAGITLEQNAIKEGGQQLEQANQGIDAQAQAELVRQHDIANQQAFTTSERLGGQEYGAQQAELGRKFATSERLGGQDFTAGQSALGRQFTTSEREAAEKYGTSERLGAQDFSHGERLGQQDFAHGERVGSQDFASSEAVKARNAAAIEAQKARDLQNSQFQQQFGFTKEQFAHEKDVDAFNMDLAKKLANQKDPIERILGPQLDALEGAGGWISKGVAPALGKIGLGSLGNSFGGGGGSFGNFSVAQSSLPNIHVGGGGGGSVVKKIKSVHF